MEGKKEVEKTRSLRGNLFHKGMFLEAEQGIQRFRGRMIMMKSFPSVCIYSEVVIEVEIMRSLNRFSSTTLNIFPRSGFPFLLPYYHLLYPALFHEAVFS